MSLNKGGQDDKLYTQSQCEISIIHYDQHMQLLPQSNPTPR